MLMTNFLSSRKSTRNFKSRDVSANTMEKLKDVFRSINVDREKAITFHIYDDGKAIFKGLNGHAGYNGVMIDAPAYITLELAGASDREVVLGMYRAEEMISLLEEEGLASCWISLFDTPAEVKEKVFGYGVSPDLLLAVGYPKARNPFVAEETTERLPVDDIVYGGTYGQPITLETLEKMNLDDLFYYVRFAPSTLNSQTWRFVVQDQRISLYLVESKGKYYFADAGIMMYYFEKMLSMVGYHGKWQLVDQLVPQNGICHIADIAL